LRCPAVRCRASSTVPRTKTQKLVQVEGGGNRFVEKFHCLQDKRGSDLEKKGGHFSQTTGWRGKKPRRQ